MGGKNISRYTFPNNSKKYILKEYVTDEKAIIQNNSILVQNIVSYTDTPESSIIIRAIPSELVNHTEYILLDTINQLSNKSNLSIYYILALLNSKLISWYTFKFIYGNAVMTMHFDSIVTSRIPVPNIDLNKKDHIKKYEEIVEYTKKILFYTKNSSNTTIDENIIDLEDKIEKIIVELFTKLS